MSYYSETHTFGTYNGKFLRFTCSARVSESAGQPEGGFAPILFSLPYVLSDSRPAKRVYKVILIHHLKNFSRESRSEVFLQELGIEER